ncbi:hypothetical protein D9M71_560850 [compost metagenome]
MQLDQMVEHTLADIRDAALADPRHQIEAGKRANRQTDDQHEEQQDRAVQQFRRLGKQPLVHQQANTLPQRQGDGSGEQQRDQRTERPPTIGSEEGTGQTQGTALA